MKDDNSFLRRCPVPGFKYGQGVVVETREGSRKARFMGHSSYGCVHLRLLDERSNETGHQITIHQKWVTT